MLLLQFYAKCRPCSTVYNGWKHLEMLVLKQKSQLFCELIQEVGFGVC